MRVLLTGGTGYVGRMLREKIHEDGHQVRLLVRKGSVTAVGPSDPYEVVRGDIMDTHACLRAADGCEAVVNLVGIIREYPRDGTTYQALHTEATHNIADAARRMGIERFVQMSALGARPDARSRYHVTKFEAEEIVRQSNMRWTIFRPSVIFHSGCEFIRQLVDLVRRPVVPVIDGGKALLQPISLENVTGPMARCLHMPETQDRVYEMGGPDRIPFVDLVGRTASYYKVWMNTMPVSSGFLRPLVRAMQRFSTFPLTVDQMEMLIEDNVCDPEPFRQAFGIEKLDSFLEALPSLLDAVERKAA
jgi:uncharacterized protein YbjT (DUF2867 family)